MLQNREIKSAHLYQQATSSDVTKVQKAFQELGAYLFKVARHVLNRIEFDDSIAEDCAQLALQDIWRSMREGKGPEDPQVFLAWAGHIVTRKCVDRIRYLDIRRTESLDSDITEFITVMDPIGEVLLNEKRANLLIRIRQHPLLSEQSKTVLIDGFFFEKTDEEIALALETTEGNVRLIRHRALSKLRSDSELLAEFRD